MAIKDLRESHGRANIFPRHHISFIVSIKANSDTILGMSVITVISIQCMNRATYSPETVFRPRVIRYPLHSELDVDFALLDTMMILHTNRR